jgi:hypothetical protein
MIPVQLHAPREIQAQPEYWLESALREARSTGASLDIRSMSVASRLDFLQATAERTHFQALLALFLPAFTEDFEIFNLGTRLVVCNN